VLAYIEQLFRHNLPADEVAAIVIEPIQGEGGYLVSPDGFLQGLRALCDKHGILLVFDEVQCGIGRTGKMFACEHWGVRPDIVTVAKGLASGMPIGLMVACKALTDNWKRGAHGNTFGGNPVCAAAASATLRVVERELRANAARAGERFMTKLRGLMQRYDVIGDVRGKGLMIGMELVEDRASKRPAPALAEALIRQAFQNGLLLLTCGVSTVRFMPPLVVSDALVDEGIDILDQSLSEVLARPAARSA